MIGTLVISLPAEGSGGDLVVRHLGEETVADLCVRDPAMLAFAAFYADCEHETKPVTEGHRVSLVFNLVLSGPEAERLSRAPGFSDKVERAAGMPSAWSRKADLGGKVVWLLDHDYSQAGLSLDSLKGRDAAIAETLTEAASRAQCSLQAAIVHLTEIGGPPDPWSEEIYDDTPMEEVYDWERTMDAWAAIDGSRPAYGPLPLLDGELLPEGSLADAEPDEVRVEGRTGNEGATLDHLYRRAVLVIWPQDRLVATIARGSMKRAIEHVEAAVDIADRSERGAVTGRRLAEQLVVAWEALQADQQPSSDKAELFARLTSLMVRVSHAPLALRFLADHAALSYSGAANPQLTEAAGLVGPGNTARFLTEVVATGMSRAPGDPLSLLWRMNKAHCESHDGPWRDLLSSATATAVTTLAVALAPPSPTGRYAYRRERKHLDGPSLCNLMSLLYVLKLSDAAANAVRMVCEHPTLVTPDRTVPEALASFRKRHRAAVAWMPYAELWLLAASWLLRRSSQPPRAPADWIIQANLKCGCSGCAQPAAFCADPVVTTASIAVSRRLRTHLRTKIDSLSLDLDYRTDPTGRPYSLVVTKNRSSFRRRIEEYDADRRVMNTLIPIAPTAQSTAASGSELDALKAATSVPE